MSQTPTDPRLPDDLDRALGNAIRLRRRSLNLTQDELGAACGISFQQIQKYENGANRVSFSRLVQIARALHCRVSDLTSALDQPHMEPADFEFLKLMTLPGAVDLLKLYAQLPTTSRGLLVHLLASMLGAGGEEPAAGDD
jgi:transcriptional regulator with XRE-family HTH domain